MTFKAYTICWDEFQEYSIFKGQQTITVGKIKFSNLTIGKNTKVILTGRVGTKVLHGDDSPVFGIEVTLLTGKEIKLLVPPKSIKLITNSHNS
jgi:hypothetical protein